jgi:hypothetical protein
MIERNLLFIKDTLKEKTEEEIWDALDCSGKLHLLVTNSIEKSVLTELRKRKELPSEIKILAILYYLKSYVSSNLNHTSATWIKGNSNFQKFIHKHFYESFSKFFSRKDDFTLSSDVYLVCEKLASFGFVDHVHKPIRIPKNQSYYQDKHVTISSAKYSARIDRAINQWGEEFIEKLEKYEEFSDSLTRIRKTVYAAQEVCKSSLVNLKDAQLLQKKKGVFLDNTNNYERTIRNNGGCVIKFV